MDIFTHVEGRDAGEVVLYALSTCVWCRKARLLLDSLGVAYSYVYVDQLPRRSRRGFRTMQAFNPRRSFPTIVVNGSVCIPGFDEKATKEALA